MLAVRDDGDEDKEMQKLKQLQSMAANLEHAFVVPALSNDRCRPTYTHQEMTALETYHPKRHDMAILQMKKE
jgi:hypothetical protein